MHAQCIAADGSGTSRSQSHSYQQAYWLTHCLHQDGHKRPAYHPTDPAFAYISLKEALYIGKPKPCTSEYLLQVGQTQASGSPMATSRRTGLPTACIRLGTGALPTIA